MADPPPIPQTTEAAIAAWSRLRRLMRRLMLGVVALVALAGVAVWRHRGMVPVRFAIIAAVGTGMLMLVASGLMGLAHLRRARRNNPPRA